MRFWLSMLVLGAVACHGKDGPATDGSVDTDTDTTSVGDTDVLTADEQACRDACVDLIGCGVGFTLDACTAGCVDPGSAPYRACLTRTEPSDCNGAALCLFEAACGVDDVPQGALTCQEAQDCGALCIGSPDVQCSCDCNRQTDPAVAIDMYRLFVCWTTSCPVECGATGNAVACGACLDAHCADEDAVCD